MDDKSSKILGIKKRTISGPNKQLGLKAGEFVHVKKKDNQIIWQSELKRKKKLKGSVTTKV